MPRTELKTNLVGRRVKPGKMFRLEIPRSDPPENRPLRKQQQEHYREMRKQHWGPTAHWGEICTVYQDSDGAVWYQVDCEDGVIRTMAPMMVEIA